MALMMALMVVLIVAMPGHMAPDRGQDAQPQEPTAQVERDIPDKTGR